MTEVLRRLANAADLSLSTFVPLIYPQGGGISHGSPQPCLRPLTMLDQGQTVQTLIGMGWPRSPNYGEVGIPDDAFSFVQSYLDAGTGEESISTKMPLLIWLVFMEYIDSKTLLDAISRTLSGAGAMQVMFADAWCRQILLDHLPELSVRREEAAAPNENIQLLPKGEGVEADSFTMACLASRILNKEINARTFENRYGTLSDLLMRWKNNSGYGDGSGDQLIRDTLFQLISNWGKTMKDGGTVNRLFAKRLFRAMGGLIRHDD